MLLVQSAQVDVTDEDLSLGEPVEARHAVEEGGLARAGRAHDGAESTRGELHRHSIEGADRGVP